MTLLSEPELHAVEAMLEVVKAEQTRSGVAVQAAIASVFIPLLIETIRDLRRQMRHTLEDLRDELYRFSPIKDAWFPWSHTEDTVGSVSRTTMDQILSRVSERHGGTA